MNKFNKTALIILDGWGNGQDPERSAIAKANTPYMKSLLAKYPNTELITYGEDVGLPEGQMGNSEVGHINLGAGRVVYQDFARINVAVKTRELHDNATLLDALEYAHLLGKNVHFMGLVSDGGVHSHINHLKALCDITQEHGLQNVFIHAFTDGRDTSPSGGLGYMTELENHIKGTTVKVASICGRYYAMDRDKRWERVKLAYDLMVHGIGEGAKDSLSAIKACYDAGLTDEFIKPIFIQNSKGEPTATFQEGDVVLAFNFRTDRCREITEVLTQTDMPEQGMETVGLYYLTMTRYDESFEGVHVLFDKDDLTLTLGEVLANNRCTQYRIAETEKYPHVTFFFNGGREEPFSGETRGIIPSPKVATYDLQPEMSAPEVKAAVIAKVKADQPDFICLNFANADMVGHTGVFSAAVKAAETVDACLQEVMTTLLEYGYASIVLADHGNSDYMINDDGSPNTAHTTNPVPCILVGDNLGNITLKSGGKLGDVAPTILNLMQIPIPDVMTGNSLI